MLQKNPIIIESTTTHTTTTRTIKVTNEALNKLQRAAGNGTGGDYNFNFNLKDDSGKSSFNPFETKTHHKFRGQPAHPPLTPKQELIQKAFEEMASNMHLDNG